MGTTQSLALGSSGCPEYDPIVEQRNACMRAVFEELRAKHAVTTSASLQLSEGGSGLLQLEGGDTGLSDADDEWLLLKVQTPSLGEENFYMVNSSELRHELSNSTDGGLASHGADPTNAPTTAPADGGGGMLYRLTRGLMESISWRNAPTDTDSSIAMQPHIAAAAAAAAAGGGLYVTPHEVTQHVEALKLQMAEMLRLKAELEQLKCSIAIDSSRIVRVQPTAADLAFIDDAIAFTPAPFNSAAPPPPPPPPAGGGAAKPTSTPGEKRAPPKPKPLTRDQLRRRVADEIESSDVSRKNKQLAVENFVAAFPDNAIGNSALEKLVVDYSFLISSFPLRPKTCFTRMRFWEKNLFSKLSPAESSAYRKRKTVEITKLADESEILIEIGLIFQTIEAKRKEQKLKEEAAKTKENAGSMITELKDRLVAEAEKSAALVAQDELQQMESGAIEPDTIADWLPLAADTQPAA